MQKAFLCQRWHSLPDEIERQDYGELVRITAVLNVFEAFKAYRHREPGKEGDWMKRYPDAWRIIEELDYGK